MVGLSLYKKHDRQLTKIVKCPQCKYGHICDVPKQWKISKVMCLNPNIPHLILKCGVCRNYVIVQWQTNNKDAEINVQ
jgi:cytochrome c-type biogenesis protein CcmH/NrfF